MKPVASLTWGLIAAAMFVAGCAASGVPNPEQSTEPMTVTEGRRVATLRCAACHAVTATGDSPRFDAPPFSRLRIRYNAISWERVMADIAAGRHGEMPPITLDSSDVRYVRAYIETLR